MAARRKEYGPPRTDFGPAPPGYIPGIGRGAVGFTTRSDIGPGITKNSMFIPERGQGPAELARRREALKEMQNEEEAAGAGALASTAVDEEDREADRMYQAIDDRMAQRNKRARERALREKMEAYSLTRPAITRQFADITKEIAEMKTEDWASLPESLDLVKRTKTEDPRNSVSAVPDSVFAATALAAHHSQTVSSISVSGIATTAGYATPLQGGYATPLALGGGAAGYATPLAGVGTGGSADLTQLGRARDKMLGMRLDRLAQDTVGTATVTIDGQGDASGAGAGARNVVGGTQTVVDRDGYLTQMAAMSTQTAGDVGDIKKMRVLFKSLLATNPHHGPGWIAAASLERDFGSLETARKLISDGCEKCPEDEDVWLAAASIHGRGARAVLAKAVTHLPHSIKIWLHAASLEDTAQAKRAVLRRGLEVVPQSVVLWKAAIALEAPEEARAMLSRAVEIIPTSADLWLALARLSPYTEAREVLNRARRALPTEPSIWLTAAKLEEANGNTGNVRRIVQLAIASLSAHQVVIPRDGWLKEATLAELAGAPATCHAIVYETLGMGVDARDRRGTWGNDAARFAEEGFVETARAVYAHMSSEFPSAETVWRQWAGMERARGTKESLHAVLSRAVEACPHAEELWLLAAKEQWVAGDVDAARAVLTEAIRANPDSEEIWLAAGKLEFESQEHERAVALFAKARVRASSPRVWMKSAKIARILGREEEELQLLTEGLERYPLFPKFHLMLAEYHKRRGEMDAARAAYRRGTKACPQSVELWTCHAAFEAAPPVGSAARARSVLEAARLALPTEPRLWLAACRLEQEAGTLASFQQTVAAALRTCPGAGALWAFAAETDPRAVRRARVHDALKACMEDAHVFLVAAKMFWADRKVNKARTWFDRAVTADPDLGDVWAYYYRFEAEQEQELAQAQGDGQGDGQDGLQAGRRDAVVARCEAAAPRHGELWCSVAKKDTKVPLTTREVLTECAKKIEGIFPKPHGAAAAFAGEG